MIRSKPLLTMKTPFGRECRYFRGRHSRNFEECRLIQSGGWAVKDPPSAKSAPSSHLANNAWRYLAPRLRHFRSKASGGRCAQIPPDRPGSNAAVTFAIPMVAWLDRFIRCCKRFQRYAFYLFHCSDLIYRFDAFEASSRKCGFTSIVCRLRPAVLAIISMVCFNIATGFGNARYHDKPAYRGD